MLGGEGVEVGVGVEERACMVLGVLVDPPEGKEGWVDGGWEYLGERYGVVGRDLYDVARGAGWCGVE